MSDIGSWKLKLRFEDESKNGRGICSSVTSLLIIADHCLSFYFRYMNTCTALRYKPAFIATWKSVGFLCGGSRVRSSVGAKGD